ncbi:MAG: T9SS type A sorting domain-containing protein [Bacteroidales bacterium]|nr:T9SS type A sorting domain-containing protein [Bacteroidales bacterium]
MKKILLSMILVGLMVPAIAQQYNTPTVFHNQWERMQYQFAHPELLSIQGTAPLDRGDYVQKLDSVIGADDFDRTRWKNLYTYSEGGKVETSYLWEAGEWQPDLMTETTWEDDHDLVLVSRWRNEAWEPYQRVRYQYRNTESGRLLETVLTEAPEANEWVEVNYTVYEYNEQGQQLLYAYYNGKDVSGEWLPSIKSERVYGDEGQVVCRITYNGRNGSWRETQKDSLFYDDNQHCVELMVYRKGGWGPGANQWRPSERFEIAYTDAGQVASETCYSAGWMGSELNLDNKTQYYYDARGNAQKKTVSIFNEVDWVVRDVYENVFDASVNANEVLGLSERWSSLMQSGMTFVLEGELPLYSGWRSCSIASSYLDTQYTLYCSGFQTVGEQPVTALKAWGDQGRLIVTSPTAIEVAVYDLTGRRVALRSNVTACEFNLIPGLYLVRGGGEVVKVMVR